ncbi:MAG: hypothetical protein ACQEW2_23195 [Bacillota bacterium]
MLYEHFNDFHIGEITLDLEEKIGGVGVRFDEGELVYVISEMYDPLDSENIICFLVKKPVSKQVIGLDTKLVNIFCLGDVLRLPFQE